MLHLPAIHLRKLVASVELTDHALVARKVERLLLKALNLLANPPRRAPDFAPWIVVAIDELVTVGALQLSEASPLIRQGRLQMRLDVFFRPLEVETWEAEDSEYDEPTEEEEEEQELEEDDDDIQLVDLEDWFPVDLTSDTDGDELSLMAASVASSAVSRKRRKQQLQEQEPTAWKRPRFSTPCKVDEYAIPYFDESMENYENDDQCKDAPSEIIEQPFQVKRMCIFCPRVFRQRFLSAIMSAMDNLPPWEPVPQFKRNGYKLDTVWFVPVDAYSTNWLVSTVENLSKKPWWHRAGIFIEPWSQRFVMRNVIRFTLPWKPGGPGNGMGRVVQRLRKANGRHGSQRWNQIGCRVVGGRINVFMAVNDYSFRSLARAHFAVFYGFSRYRCQVVERGYN